MQSTRSSIEKSLNALHDYVKAAIDFRANKKDDNPGDQRTLKNKLNNLINSTSSWKDENIHLYHVLKAFAYYYAFYVDGISSTAKISSNAIGELLKYNNKNYFPKKLLPYANYLLVILAIMANDGIIAYLNIKKDELLFPLLRNIRNTVQKLIKAKKGKNDLVLKNARVLLAHLYFIYQFVPIEIDLRLKSSRLAQAQSKRVKELGEFLDITAFEKLRSKISKEYNLIALSDRTIEDKCFLMWFSLNYCTIANYNSARFPNPKRIYYEIDYAEYFSFFKEICTPELSAPYDLIPGFSLGLNFVGDLAAQRQDFIRTSQEKLALYLYSLDKDTIIKDCHHPDWNELYQGLIFKKNIMLFKRRTAIIPRDIFSIIAFASESEIEENISLKNQKLIDTMNEVRENQQKKHQQNFEQEMAMAKYKLSLKPECKKSKAVITKRTDHQSSDDENNNKPIENDISDEIYTLIKNKMFYKASLEASELKRIASESQDNLRLAKAYCYLGDIFFARSKFSCDSLKSISLAYSRDYYSLCINTIDTILEKPDKLLLESIEEIYNLRDYLRNLIKPVEVVQNTIIKPVCTPVKADFVNQPAKTTEKPMPSWPLEIVLPDEVDRIGKKLDASGHLSYLVGGTPRDYPLSPHDYDIVTTASMKEIMEMFVNEGALVGNAYPVFLIKVNKKEIQISPMISRMDHSMPESVHLNNGMLINLFRTKNMIEDAEHRVLSCNALYYDWRLKRIFDPCSGRQDVLNKQIRFICSPTETLQSDPSLILRILSLMIRFGYKIDKDTEELLLNNLHNLARINMVRISNEINKLFLHNDYYINAMKIFEKYHLFKYIYQLSDDIENSLLARLKNIFNDKKANDAAFHDLFWMTIITANNLYTANISRAEIIKEYDTGFNAILNSFGIHVDKSDNLPRLLLLFLLKSKNLLATNDIFQFTEGQNAIIEKLLNPFSSPSTLLSHPSVFFQFPNPVHIQDRCNNTLMKPTK